MGFSSWLDPWTEPTMAWWGGACLALATSPSRGPPQLVKGTTPHEGCCVEVPLSRKPLNCLRLPPRVSCWETRATFWKKFTLFLGAVSKNSCGWNSVTCMKFSQFCMNFSHMWLNSIIFASTSIIKRCHCMSEVISKRVDYKILSNWC